jgi:hypothetical protein
MSTNMAVVLDAAPGASLQEPPYSLRRTPPRKPALRVRL